MKTSTAVNIARFKAHLGRFLARVRKGGELVLLDRRTPVAKVIPFHPDERLKIPLRKPEKDPSGLAKLSFPPVKDRKTDSLSVLLEDRKSR